MLANAVAEKRGMLEGRGGTPRRCSGAKERSLNGEIGLAEAHEIEVGVEKRILRMNTRIFADIDEHVVVVGGDAVDHFTEGAKDERSGVATDEARLDKTQTLKSHNNVELRCFDYGFGILW